MSEPELELGAYIAHLPPDLEGVVAPLYRRMAFISASLLPALGAGAGQDLPALEADLQAALTESEEKLSELQLAGYDYDPPLSGAVVAASDAASRDLQRIRARAQEAVLRARRTVRARARAEPMSGANARAALGLDTGGAYRSSRTTGTEGGDQVAQASSDMTTALERAVSLMSEELGKSSFSAELLQESSDAMAQLAGSYTSFEGLLHTSQAMVKKLKRQDVQDRIAVLASLAFFVFCVLYILKQRLVDPTFGGVAGLASGTYRSLRWGVRLLTSTAGEADASVTPPAATATAVSAAVAATGLAGTRSTGAGLSSGGGSVSGGESRTPPSHPAAPAVNEPVWTAVGASAAESVPEGGEWVWEHDPVLDAEWDATSHPADHARVGTQQDNAEPKPGVDGHENIFTRQDSSLPPPATLPAEYEDVLHHQLHVGQPPINSEESSATHQESDNAASREGDDTPFTLENEWLSGVADGSSTVAEEATSDHGVEILTATDGSAPSPREGSKPASLESQWDDAVPCQPGEIKMDESGSRYEEADVASNEAQSVASEDSDNHDLLQDVIEATDDTELPVTGTASAGQADPEPQPAPLSITSTAPTEPAAALPSPPQDCADPEAPALSNAAAVTVRDDTERPLSTEDVTDIYQDAGVTKSEPSVADEDLSTSQEHIPERTRADDEGHPGSTLEAQLEPNEPPGSKSSLGAPELASADPVSVLGRHGHGLEAFVPEAVQKEPSSAQDDGSGAPAASPGEADRPHAGHDDL